jgi:hypothetical protein
MEMNDQNQTPAVLSPGGNAGTHGRGSCVGHRDILNVLEKKVLHLPRFEPRIFHPVTYPLYRLRRTSWIWLLIPQCKEWIMISVKYSPTIWAWVPTVTTVVSIIHYFEPLHLAMWSRVIVATKFPGVKLFDYLSWIGVFFFENINNLKSETRTVTEIINHDVLRRNIQFSCM